MSYCTLEEAWGSDFKKKHKKSKKEKRLESQEKTMLQEAVDPQILIPDTPRLADRRSAPPQPIQGASNSSIQGFDESDMFMSPYHRYSQGQPPKQRASQSSLISDIEKPIDDLIHLTKKEYDNLRGRVVEGFGNRTDEQFNQLLLFVFTGILYMFMLDMMYQLGKKSY
jgi:hypothetical protein